MLMTMALFLLGFAGPATALGILTPGQQCSPRYVADSQGECSRFGTEADNSTAIFSVSSPDFEIVASTWSTVSGTPRVATGYNLYSDTMVHGVFLGRALGSRGTPLPVVSGNSLGTFGWKGWNETDMETLSAGINASPEFTFSPTERRSSIRFFTAPDGVGAVTSKMRLSSAGNLRVGDDAIATNRLEVAGDVVSTGAITGTFFYGDGSGLSNIPGGSVNADDVGAGTFDADVVIPTSGVDLSTITTALAGKQATDADLDDLADGSLTASKLGSGYSGANVSGAVATATALAADGANCAGGQAPLGVDASGAVQGCFTPGGGSEGNTFTSSKTFTAEVLAKSSVSASSYFVQGSSVNTIFGMMKRRVAADQIFYTSATSNFVTGLDFPLARNTSYYFEYEIIHQSTATATGVWFGMSYPVGSTITWKSDQMISLVATTVNMSRGAAFTTASGASVDVANANLFAKISGAITTSATAGNIQPLIKMELQTGRGVVKVGSSGRLHEQ